MGKKRSQMNVGIVLDRSGSMFGGRLKTIEGFNDYVRGLPKSLVSLITFASETERTIVATDSTNVPPLTEANYVPDGLTALFDAVGDMITLLDQQPLAKNGQVLVCIITDGEENNSRVYSRDRVFQMVEARKKLGWGFVFIGANIDSFKAGAAIGIGRGSIASYAADDTRKAFTVAQTASRRYAGGQSIETLVSDDPDGDE